MNRAIVLAGLLIFFCACSREEKPVNTLSFNGMGGPLAVTYTGAKDEKMEAEIQEFVKNFEAEVSYYKKESTTSRANATAHAAPVAISDRFCRLLTRSVEATRATNGRFDVSYKSEGWLWDIYRNQVPDQADVRKFLPLIGIENLDFDCTKKTLSFKKEGVKLDFGGIASGFAADETRSLLERYGHRDFIVNYTGDILVCGSKYKKPWVIGVKDPFQPDTFLKTLDIPTAGCTGVSTSGDYERYIEKNGKKYSHIIDPKTGNPVEGAHSVTVIASDGTLADALATAFSVGWRDDAFIRETAKRLGVHAYLLTGEKATLTEY